MASANKYPPQQAPTLTPSTLGGLVFQAADWPNLLRAGFSTFHINRLETARPHLRFPMPPHRKTVTDFILVTRGHMMRSKSLDRYEVPAGTVFFLPAHQLNFCEWMSDDIQGYYCHFTHDLLTNPLQQQPLSSGFPFLNFLGNPLVALGAEPLAHLLTLLRRLEAEYQHLQADSMELIRLYLLACLLELNRAALAPAAAPAAAALDNAPLRLTQRYKSALARFIYEKQAVADYAALLHISPNHLNKCVKAVTGQSARAMLDEMILLEAKALLAQTTLDIGEIAYRIGKQEPSSFARFLKSKTGLTPHEYRTAV